MRRQHLARARAVFDLELAGLKAVRAQLDTAFERAVEVMVEALGQRRKIIVVGIGKSGHVGQKIAATLTSTGSTSVVLNSVDALHGDLGLVSDGDVVLALSYSGESDELLNLLPALRRFSVNARGKLVGVFTDGDFRRHIAADQGVLGRRLAEVMTRQPITIHQEALAAEALKVFNERNIDDLIVVNSRHEPVGLVDSQDLPRLKLM
jgi:CBS domain-containing protein